MTPEQIDAELTASLCEERPANFRFADLRGADFSRRPLRRADFTGARLDGANLEQAHLAGANFKDAFLSRANLEYAVLDSANLQGALLSYALLQGAFLTDADLRLAILAGARVRNVFWPAPTMVLFYNRAVPSDALEGIHYLQDSSAVIEGFKFWGSPWQPWFGGYAFNLNRGPELRDKWDLIPGDVDVLVTHGPPWGVRDKVRNRLWCGGVDDRMVHVGCRELLAAVKRVQPQVHVFGHIHEGYGCKLGSPTTYVNAAIWRVREPSNKPIVVSVARNE